MITLQSTPSEYTDYPDWLLLFPISSMKPLAVVCWFKTINIPIALFKAFFDFINTLAGENLLKLCLLEKECGHLILFKWLTLSDSYCCYSQLEIKINFDFDLNLKHIILTVVTDTRNVNVWCSKCSRSQVQRPTLGSARHQGPQGHQPELSASATGWRRSQPLVAILLRPVPQCIPV